MNKEIKFERGLVRHEYERLKEVLVGKLKEEAERQGESAGIFWELVGGGNEVTLGITSDGCWEGLAGVTQWNIGKNPSIARLLSNYALASDNQEYIELLKLTLARRGKTDRLNRFLEENKGDLMIALTGEMQSAISELDKMVKNHP